MVCIKDEAQRKGIVHDNIQELREYEYKNVMKVSQEEVANNKKMTEERIFREHAKNTAALILSHLKKQIRVLRNLIRAWLSEQNKVRKGRMRYTLPFTEGWSSMVPRRYYTQN